MWCCKLVAHPQHVLVQCRTAKLVTACSDAARSLENLGGHMKTGCMNLHLDSRIRKAHPSGRAQLQP